MSPDQPDPVGRGVSGLRPSRIRSPTRVIPPQEDHADELDVSHHIDGRGIVPFDADLPKYSLASVQGSVASCRPSSRVTHLALRSPMRAPSRWNDPYEVLCRPARCGQSESSRVSAPTCRELRAPKSGGRVMFGRVRAALIIDQNPSPRPMMSVNPAKPTRLEYKFILTSEEAAEFLGVSLRTIRYWVATRRIPSR
jgi:hypothetical protein